MYLQHFQLNIKPFEIAPCAQLLYPSKKHQLALTAIEYGITEQSGITVLTGEVGSGKTTVIQAVLEQLKHVPIHTGIVNNTYLHDSSLYTLVAMAYGLDFEGKSDSLLLKNLQDFFIDQYAQGRTCLLIIDEAQNLQAESLERLRLLTNINTVQDKLLQLVLVGQPELKDILADHCLAQFAQRISVEYHLTAFDWDDTKEYIRHRLKLSGAEQALFDEPALAVIFYHSGGIPRLINTLCDQALVHAFAEGIDKISFKTAIDVIRSRSISGVNRFKTTRAQTERIRRIIQDKLGVDIAC